MGVVSSTRTIPRIPRDAPDCPDSPDFAPSDRNWHAANEPRRNLKYIARVVVRLKDCDRHAIRLVAILKSRRNEYRNFPIARKSKERSVNQTIGERETLK